jgi:hypothetical protein
MKITLTQVLLAGLVLLCPAATQAQSYSLPKDGEVDLDAVRELPFRRQLKEMPKQGPEKGVPSRQSFVIGKSATVTFSAITRDLSPSLMIREMPGPRRDRPERIPGAGSAKVSQSSQSTLQPLTKGTSYYGNFFNGYVPNDNDLAISDSGWVVSVINCEILMINTKTNHRITKSLGSFTSPINQNHQEFDPKVIYDPENDRFILLTLVGFRDSTSKLIVGFSKTDNPTGQWNLYSFPGNPLNNNLWSDYPMLAITKKEVFITVNLLYEDSTWQKGFVQTLIWQASKDSGYAGKNLATFLHSNIKYNGKNIRNLCPVKGGSRSYGPEMYFLSNRNFAAQNDTVFLLKIADTLGSPGSSITVKALKTSQPYYFPSDGRQPMLTQSLSTNDSRNLGAFLENGMIQYVHNTNNPANGRVTVYYGTIAGAASASPAVTGYIIDNDTMDFAYPNISYAGLDSSDNTAIIGFDHTSDKVFAGCSAVQADAQGNFSPILRIQNGTTYVDLWNDTINTERWGDYTGSQRRYDKPGEVWMSGFVGSMYNSIYKAHRTWIAQISTYEGMTVRVPENQAQEAEAVVFPNPAKDIVRVSIPLSEPEYLNFLLFDAQGKLVEVLMREYVRGRENLFTFRTSDLSRGVYFLKVTGNKGTELNKKIIVN